jgi:hypothetical protein
MFCAMCGAPNENDAEYCGNCGSALSEDVKPTEAAVDTALELTAETPAETRALPQVDEIKAENPEPEAVPPLAEPTEVEAPVAPPPALAPAEQFAPTSGLAIASLVLGVGGLTVLPLIGSIAAIILGYMARNEIRRRPGEVSGLGMAMAGLIMGWIPVALAVVIGILALVGVVAAVCGFGLCGLTGSNW